MIFEKIRALIAEQFGVDEDSITMETNVLEDLEADSLDIVELSMAMESEFNLDEMKEIADNRPGFIRAMWCGDRECEDKLKEVCGVTSRCIPFEQETISDTCVCCGKKADKMLYWGKAY